MSNTVLNESILNSTKKLLGIHEDVTVFDLDIAFHINTVFANLIQMGVGPQAGYRISSADNVWSEFSENDLLIENVKSYVYLKVKLLFDPPTNSALISAIESQAKELEWRMYTQKGGY